MSQESDNHNPMILKTAVDDTPPFDTPAARAAQGERTLTVWVSRKNPVRAEPVEA